MRRTKIGEMNSTGETNVSVCWKLSGGSHFQWLWAVVASVLFLLTGAAFADFPPYLVIDSVVYPGTQVSGTGGQSYFKYSTDSDVLILSGSNGGPAKWGATEQIALTNPSLSGAWNNDCSQAIVLSGSASVSVPGIVIPQVVICYPSADCNSGYMHTYDSDCYKYPMATGTTSAGGFLVAYNGMYDGLIFTCNETSFYRYQAGPVAMVLDTTLGWPSADISVFPSQIYYNGDTLAVSSFTEGLGSIWSGYWSNIYYEGIKPDGVTRIYGEMHVSIAGDGSTGLGEMWGVVEDTAISAQWDAGTHVFIADSSFGSAVTNMTNAPSYGPPNLECHGTILWFKYHNVNGSDVYCDSQKQSWAVVDSSYVVTVAGAYGRLSLYYDGTFRNADADENPWAVDVAAVSSDGYSILGLDGVTVITSGSFLVANIYANVYSLHRPDGKSVFVITPFFNDVLPPYCQFWDENGPTPIYQTKNIDASNGWPQSDAPSPQSFPAQAYAYGMLLNCDSVDGPWVNGTNSFAYTIYHYSGMGFALNVCSQNDGVQNYSFSGPNGDSSSGPLPDANITFGSFSPRYGPPQVSWDGTSAMFSYTDVDSNVDVYSADGAPPFRVTVDSSSCVTVSGTQLNLTGTYNASTYQFNLSGGTLLAQDAVGNLLGTPPGLIIYSAAPWAGSVLLAGGHSSDGNYSSWGGAIYKFKRNDGSFGIKFLGIPQGTLIIVQNQDGSVSPYYRYSEKSGDFVLNTIVSGGWPTSSIWPSQLYVNGHYTSLDATSEAVLNNGYTRQVSYHVQPGGETIMVNWNGNSGSVGGSSSYGSFSGTWDGGNLFSTSNGTVITTTPPSYIARYGPPQIKWNGVELVFAPFASAVSATNPQGLDIYRDSLGLGLRASIDSNHGVILYLADGTALVGSYTPGTYQFDFGTQATGSVQADSTQGFVLSTGRGTSSGQGTSNATMEALGNFDIQGNVLSLGNWTNAYGNSTPGLMLTFTSGTNNQASTLRFAAVRKTTDWVWSHANPDGGSTQITMMKLDASNRLKLFDPAVQTTGTTAQPTIVLDPAVSGTSQFKGAVLIQPQGDLDMGQYTTGNAPQ